MEGKYTYFAFISYKREDEKWAKWLQSKLESYRLPSVLQKQGKLPRSVKPVFRDKTDLASGPLEETLCRQLKESKCLIVICSRELTDNSRWVDYEVEAFAGMGRAARIIPFIVDGVPNAEKTREECFPPSLKNLPEEPLGISVKESGKRGAFLKTVAAILDIRADNLIRRDRRRMYLKGAVILPVILAVLLFAGAAANYFMPHEAYYSDYELRYGVPVGIDELTAEETKHRSQHYTLITTRNRVRELRLENSRGELLDGFLYQLSDRPLWARFSYSDDGKIHQMQYLNRNGYVYFKWTYTSDLLAVDFSGSGDSGEYTTLGLDLSQSGALGDFNRVAGSDDKSKISRYRLTYNEDGYVIQRKYCPNNVDTDGQDANGVGGVVYELDSQGRRIRESYLDRNGDPMVLRNGVACVTYAYPQEGKNELEVAYWDEWGKPAAGPEGYFREKNTLDENDNCLATAYYDIFDRLMYNKEQNAAIMKAYYDGIGLRTAYESYNTAEEPDENGRGHRVELEYDSRGLVKKMSFFDAEGKPCTNQDGVYSVSLQRDAWGNIVGHRGYDAEGKPMLNKAGFCEIRYEFTPEGYFLAGRVFDGQGKPVLNKAGISCCQVERDPLTGLEKSYSYFDTEGNPALREGEYTKATFAYFPSGRRKSQAYWNIDGSPAADEEGIHRVEWTYDRWNNKKSEQYYDPAGNLTENSAGIAKYAWVYDKYGQEQSEAYFDREGAPTQKKDGYYGLRAEYDHRGNKIAVTYLDENGNAMTGKSGYAGTRTQYADDGSVKDSYYCDPDGKPVPGKEGYAIWARKYDPEKREEVSSLHDAEGELMEIENGRCFSIRRFDERGNVIYQVFYNSKQERTMDDQGVYETRKVYDRYDRCTHIFYTDNEGKPMNCIEGYAGKEILYDDRGNLTSIRYYGENGLPAEPEDAFPRIDRTFDERNREIRRDLFEYDGQGNRVYDSYLFYAIEYTYDDRDHLIRELYLDENGEPAETGFNYAEIRYKRDPRGQILEKSYFDADGEPVTDQKGIFMIRYEYDLKGNVTSRQYYDTAGEPVEEAP